MASVVVFSHGADIPLGLLGDVLAARGIDVAVQALDEGDPVPDRVEWDGVVSLGGVMGAYDEADHPWLAEEKRFLAEAVSRGIPTLGLCLGCQMLAEVLGGSAYPAPVPEYGMLSIELTAAGRSDPVLRHLDAPVPVFHGDTWDLPDRGVLLAESERYPHAFRFGSALAIQAHPEASFAVTAGWLVRNRARILAAGGNPDAIEASLRSGDRRLRDMSERLFGAWVEELVARR